MEGMRHENELCIHPLKHRGNRLKTKLYFEPYNINLMLQ